MTELRLPLKVSNNWGELCIRDAENKRIISIDPINDQGEGESRAALIVRAVNYHREAQMFLRNLHTLAMGNYPKDLRDQLLVNVNEFIAKMEADHD